MYRVGRGREKKEVKSKKKGQVVSAWNKTWKSNEREEECVNVSGVSERKKKHTSTLQNTPRGNSYRVSPRLLPDTNRQRANRTQAKANGQENVDTLVGIVTKCCVLDWTERCDFLAGIVTRIELRCGGRWAG